MTMKSEAYNEAMDYALDVLKAVKESGCEMMDYALEQFVNVSIRIGANLAKAEVSMEPEDRADEYKEAEMNVVRSIYWSDILGKLEDYKFIPFDSLRKKCESLTALYDVN